MDDLLNRLAQWIVQDNAILFVGGNLRRGDGGPSPVQEIAEALARQIDYQRTDRSLPAVARDYEVLKGRNALITAVRETLERSGVELSTLDQLIADAVLPHSKVITTRFDQVLERTLDDFQKRYVLIIRDTDVPYFDESKITLIKVLGDIGQPDSLVLTEDDIDAFIERLPTISDVIRAYFATKTLIFIGYELDSELFKRVYRQVMRNLSAFHRPAYSVVPEPLSDVDTRYWESLNVHILVQDPMEFLEAIAVAIKTAVQRPEERPPNPLEDLANPPLPERPYKALDSFTGQDVSIFAGRVEESQRLTNRILAHRLTLLYGESGSGKTSLLRAGVGPRLAARRSLLAVCTPAPGQPLVDILHSSLLSAGKQADLVGSNTENLDALIRDWTHQLGGPVVVAVDQFESFFLYYSPEERRLALEVIRSLHEDRSLDLRLLLVMREDFLGKLQSIESHLPGLLDIRFRLERLGREAAREAIEEPALAFDIQWESSLVELLLDDLYASGEGGVAPPQLQIVCDRLYRALVDRKAGQEITRELFEGLGGTEAILGDYLDQAVASFSDEKQPLVRRLLGALVSSAGVKQRLGLDDLARASESSLEMAAGALEELTHQRIVMRYEIANEDDDEAVQAYELAHDSLVPRIARWLGDEFWAAQKARELVRQGLSGWIERTRLLPPEDLRLVNAQIGQVRFSPAELELIYASGVGFGDLPESLREAVGEGARQKILLSLIQHPEVLIRTRVIGELSRSQSGPAEQALADVALSGPDFATRQAAAEAIASSNGSVAGVRHQTAIDIIVAAAGQPEKAASARLALIAVCDRNPEVYGLLDSRLRGLIRRGVWSLRLRRNWRDILVNTLRGVQGGFWGLGLGMGIFLGLSSIEGPILLRLIFALVFSGISLAGIVGVMSAGTGTLVQSILSELVDKPQPAGIWLVTTLVSGLMMGVGFVFMGSGFPGEPLVIRWFLAGFLTGLGLAGTATAPLRVGWKTRLGVCVLGGASTFLLVGALQLFFSQGIGWLLVMGIASGLGFFFAMRPSIEEPYRQLA